MIQFNKHKITLSKTSKYLLSKPVLTGNKQFTLQSWARDHTLSSTVSHSSGHCDHQVGVQLATAA